MFQVIRTHRRDIATFGIKAGDETVVHQTADRTAADRMCAAFSVGRAGQYKVVSK